MLPNIFKYPLITLKKSLKIMVTAIFNHISKIPYYLSQFHKLSTPK